MSSEAPVDGQSPGPRLVVDLDQVPPDTYNPGRVYVIDGELWEWDSFGCGICAVASDSSRTFRHHRTGRARCLRHGRLVSRPVRWRRRWSLQFGPLQRQGREKIDEDLLIPAGLPAAQERDLLEELLEFAAEGIDDGEV